MRLASIISILFLTLALAAACSNQTGTPQPADNNPANQANQQDTTGDEASGTQPEVPTNENATPQIGDPSTFSADVQTDLPEGWRQDVPLLVGFEIDDFRKQGDGMMVICHGSLNIDSVTMFYSDLDGWQKNETPERPWITENSSRRLTYIRDNSTLLITLDEKDGVLNMRILVVVTAA
ncbi:MAG: hypothetical protein NTY09_04910 [bacterium]|nr:hypothetical protein [bacterium]